MKQNQACSEKECASCVKSLDHLFLGLPAQSLKELNESKSVHRYSRGQAVFYAGNPPIGLFCVSRGVVKIESVSADGKTHLLRAVGEGGILGYRSLLANESYRATAIVSEDAEVCLIPKKNFLKLIQDSPELMMRILSKLSVELRESEARFESIADKEAPERVAEAILYFKDHFPKQNWSRKELAEWAGTSPETVMRVLSKFEDEKLVALKGRVITVLDRPKLIKAANLPV